MAAPALAAGHPSFIGQFSQLKNSLAIAPNDDVLTVNAGDGLIVETTPRGHQIATFLLDNSGSPPGSGALFGLTLAQHGSGVYYVDDATKFLRLLH
jgi:hypothetical protein